MSIHDFIDVGDFIEAVVIGNTGHPLTIGKLYEVTAKDLSYFWIRFDNGVNTKVARDSRAADKWFKLPIEKNIKKDIDFLELLKGY